MPIFLSALAGSSCVIFMFAAYYITRWCMFRSKRKEYSEANTPTEDGYKCSPIPPLIISSKNISLSTPDLQNENILEEKIGKKHFKTVVKQSTLPVRSSRHDSFNRTYSHNIDFPEIEFTIQSVKYNETSKVGLIKPELYRQNAHTNENEEDPRKSQGNLFASVRYDFENENLIVTVIKATNLPAKDFSGTSDPYVKLYLLPEQKHKHQTKVQRKTLNPVFNEIFTFHIIYSQLSVKTLQFMVVDFDRFSRHDVIGIASIHDLYQNDRLKHETFYTLDIINNKKADVNLGDVMVSLCYLPTAGRLTVTIIKAKNLKAMDITGSSDPFVKLSLMCQGKRIKKKKTSVKHNCLNPIYNEALVLDVPQENINEILLIIEVIDYDRISSNELMGCVAIGPNIVGQGQKHWMEMLQNTRKPVAYWHSLQDKLPFQNGSDTPISNRGCLRRVKKSSNVISSNPDLSNKSEEGKLRRLYLNQRSYSEQNHVTSERKSNGISNIRDVKSQDNY